MKGKFICILDYGSGNVRSVYNMIKYLGYDAVVSNSVDKIKNCSHLILPGVGSFGASISKIESSIPFDCLETEVIKKGKPFLGICVGMQVLANKGFEFEEHKGFGWIPGVVNKLRVKEEPLPHIGWNDIVINIDSPIFRNLKEYRDFYYVHSYAFEVKNKSHILARTKYESTFNSVICKDNIFGFQFHPEKSQRAGQLLLNNFINIT